MTASGLRSVLMVSVSGLAIVVMAGAASAGGLAVREQSASSQGASFAGSAAGGDLSSSFWNSAAFATAKTDGGIAVESHYSLIVPDAKVTTNAGTAAPVGASAIGQEVDIGRMAVVPASYGAYRLSEKVVLGAAINAPFGLGVEADDKNWAGQRHFRSAKAMTVNFNPTLAYSVTPQIHFGVGVQIQHIGLVFKSNPGAAGASHNSAFFDVDDIGVGATAGILWTPSAATSIGLGYRSAVNHQLVGTSSIVTDRLNVGPGFGFAPVGVKAEVTLPEMVTFSFRQGVTPTTRVLGTVEWTNWSRLGTVDFVATSPGGVAGVAPIVAGQTISRFEFNWNDGWFFALGGEWDYSKALTLRAGAAYEISPIQNADQRFAAITDSDRIWLSLGANYKWSEKTSLDFAYTHIFFDDAPISRSTTPGLAVSALRADADQSVDILAASLKTRF